MPNPDTPAIRRVFAMPIEDAARYARDVLEACLDEFEPPEFPFNHVGSLARQIAGLEPRAVPIPLDAVAEARTIVTAARLDAADAAMRSEVSPGTDFVTLHRACLARCQGATLDVWLAS